MRVRIDTERCTGHGRCYTLAPGVFETDDRGYGQVIVEELPAELVEEARKAVDNCPEQAIVVE
ncbi:MAG: ferredoxin [Acidimicrobiales bacterium]